MKKALLLIASVTTVFAASAQLTLSGTSYSQNFNSITSALPTGWYGYVSSTSTSVGSLSPWDGSINYGVFADTQSTAGSCKPSIFDGAFKNYPSANSVLKSSTCAQQKLITDRAFGLRLAGTGSFPGADGGAAFVLKIANTTGATNFQATFKLQSLDTTSGKTSTWAVEYATGTTPTAFTPVTTVPATLQTGGFVFSNTPVTVNFGTALDNKSTTVWIRLVTLSASTGVSGDRRASTAVDDFNLTWTGATGVSTITSTPGVAMNVIGVASPDKVSFAYNTEEAGNYIFSIYDLTGRNIRTETFEATSGSQQISVNGLNLAPGMYFAKMSNSNSSTVAKFTVN